MLGILGRGASPRSFFRRYNIARLFPSLLVLVLLAAAIPALAGTAIVTSRGDLLTARFTQVTAAEAFAALRDATGVEVILPPILGEAALTTTVEGVTLQAAVRRILEVLGLTDFVLVFEADGRAERLVVHASASAARAAGTARALPAAPGPASVQVPAAFPAPMRKEKKIEEPRPEPAMSPEEEAAFLKEQERTSLEIFGLPPIDAGPKPRSPVVRP